MSQLTMERDRQGFAGGDIVIGKVMLIPFAPAHHRTRLDR
jgi:hypothetical protein